MQSQLVCLLTSGAPISGIVARSLLYIAQIMIAEQRTSVTFKSKLFEGGMETKFRYQCIGTLGGIQFSAEIDLAEGGSTKVRFLADQLDCPVAAFYTELETGNGIPPWLEDAETMN